MVFQPVINTVEAAIIFDQTTVSTSMTFHFERPDPYDQLLIEALASALDAWAGVLLMPNLGNQLGYVRTEVRGLSSENDLTAQANLNSGVGGIATNALPNNVAWSVRRLSGLTGRSARGRVYVPGIGMTMLQTNENLIQVALGDNIVEQLNNIIGPTAALGWTHVIVSRYSGGVRRPTGVTFPVVEYSPRDYRLDSRRDRLPG